MEKFHKVLRLLEISGDKPPPTVLYCLVSICFDFVGKDRAVKPSYETVPSILSGYPDYLTNQEASILQTDLLMNRTT